MSTLRQSSLMEEPGLVEAPLETNRQEARGSRKWLVWALVTAGLAAAGVSTWMFLSKPAAAGYSVVSIRRGNLAKTINATGKVQAVTTIQLGTQVSGTVSELHADFNDHVKAGQVIARLDPSQIQAQLLQAKASLASADARVASARSTLASLTAGVAAAKANVDRADSALLEANRAYQTTSDLVEAGVMAARDLQTSEAARNQAAAGKTQAEAQYQQSVAQGQASQSQLDQAIAEATQAKAAVEVAAVNLDRTYIRSPIDGVVVARNVDIGQTVAASLQAPTLFLIAKDLTQMQVLADVDEADVGQLSPASKVTFTVDAFPAETFQGRISQIRLAPNVVQNVTTYTAVIDVSNPKMQLKPGMTATVTATVAEKQDVLLIPNSALRFRPDGAPASAAPTPRTGTKGGARGEGTTLWKVEAEALQPVRVRLGMSDGVSTEVIGGGLAEGDRIAAPVQLQQGGSQKKAQASPFQGGARPKGGRF